ncbi:hypothetical protein K439DRAFT_1619140 [Ramaria rubella]|nr:hypothetical protein K439DRAFT_1619140 [Ramaria rubella]
MTTNSDENDASRSSIYPVSSQKTISGDEIHSIQEQRSSHLTDPVPESSGSGNIVLGNRGVVVPAAITAQPLFEKPSNPLARGAQKKGQTYLDENQTWWRINNNPPEKEERHQLTTLTNLLNAAEISDGAIKELQGELMTGQTWINGVIIHGSGKCMMEWLMRLEVVERWNSVWSQLLCLRLCAIWTKEQTVDNLSQQAIIDMWCPDNKQKQTRMKWWWRKGNNVAMICAGGGGDIFKWGQEDLRVLAMMLKSPRCEAAKSGVIRLKATIDKLAAGIYLPAWSDLDLNDLTATDSFIENEFCTCIPKLYTTRELSIWGKMIEGKELENTIGSLTTPHQTLTSRSNEIHSLDKINDHKNPMDWIYEVVMVGVPNFHSSGCYCGQEMHQTLIEPQRALAEKATLVADMDQLKLKV